MSVLAADAAIDLDALLRRLHLPTVRRLYPDLAQRAESDGLSYRDFLALLMAEEVAHRTQTRIQRCVRRAHFPFLKTIDEYDFTFQAAVRLSLLGSFLGPEFVIQGACLVLSGVSGTGKTHLPSPSPTAPSRMATRRASRRRPP
jgi:DNA replication protein DnaC